MRKKLEFNLTASKINKFKSESVMNKYKIIYLEKFNNLKMKFKFQKIN